MTTSYVNLSKKSSSKRPRKSSMDVVEKKLDMSLDDIAEERKQHSQSPNGTSGKSRNTKRSDRIALAGPYQRTTRGESGNDTVMGRRVYVGNLSYSVKSELLKDHMSAAGNVLHAMILESSTRFSQRSKGCGVVEYATEAEAARAIATLNDTEIDGRKIFVREDRESKSVGPMKSTGADENQVPNTTDGVTTTRVYVGNLSWSVKWQQLKDHMKAAGNIKHADVLVESNGRSKGCGLVEYETVEEAARAIEMLHDTELGGRKIFVREDREPEGGSIRSIAHRGTPTRPPFGRVPLGTNGSQTTLFVGNLPWDVTWQVLKEMFSSVGQVERTEIAQMPDGKSRGFGIVRFANPGDAARAIEQFNKMEMNGREIEVRYDKGRA